MSKEFFDFVPPYENLHLVIVEILGGGFPTASLLVAYEHCRALLYRIFSCYFLKDVSLRNHFKGKA